MTTENGARVMSVQEIIQQAQGGVTTSCERMYANDGPAADELRALATLCQRHGYSLARWQTNKPNFFTRVTWAVLRPGAKRASQRRYQKDEDVVADVRMTAPYGRTERSRAYKGYHGLLVALYEEVCRVGVGAAMVMLEDAVRVAIREHKRWHGAVIVCDGSRYDVIPSAYLTDITYTGPREVVAAIYNLTDWAGPEAYEADEDEQVAFMLEAIAQTSE